jgi:hypothetical protein
MNSTHNRQDCVPIVASIKYIEWRHAEDGATTSDMTLSCANIGVQKHRCAFFFLSTPRKRIKCSRYRFYVPSNTPRQPFSMIVDYRLTKLLQVFRSTVNVSTVISPLKWSTQDPISRYYGCFYATIQKYRIRQYGSGYIRKTKSLHLIFYSLCIEFGVSGKCRVISWVSKPHSILQ